MPPASNDKKKEISPALKEYCLACWRIFERLQQEKEEAQKIINDNSN